MTLLSHYRASELTRLFLHARYCRRCARLPRALIPGHATRCQLCGASAQLPSAPAGQSSSWPPSGIRGCPPGWGHSAARRRGGGRRTPPPQGALPFIPVLPASYRERKLVDFVTFRVFFFFFFGACSLIFGFTRRKVSIHLIVFIRATCFDQSSG